MQLAPIPANDSERLAALYALLILNTPPEERFDRITEFAATEFEVPVALLSFMDKDRQWFKAKVGTDLCDAPRSISFCGHAIVQSDILVVPDATLDPRFADNPVVINAPFMRFYAGAPLIMPSGFAMGTLCLLDIKPREFDALSLSILSTLRDLAVRELVEQGSSLREDEGRNG